MELVRLKDLPRAVLLALAVGVAALGLALVLAPYAAAAPRAANIDDCRMVAQVALLSRALAAEGVERTKAAAVVLHVYSPKTKAGAEVMTLVLEAAYRTRQRPLPYAEQLLKTCVDNKGDMDGVLGSDV